MKLSKVQRDALRVIAAGGCRERRSFGWPEHLWTYDSACVVCKKSTTRSLVAKGLIFYLGLNGVYNPVKITPAGQAYLNSLKESSND